MHMDRARSQLLIIDVQARLAPHVATEAEVVANTGRLLSYARCLSVPATLTEHYPKGLGATVSAVRERAAGATPVLDKIAFSCWRDAAIRARLGDLRRDGRDQIVVAGMETHVCVAQSSLDLIAAGFEVFLVADSVGSRDVAVRDIAVRRLAAAGAKLVAHEMVAFEWLGRGDDPAFREVVAILK